MYSEFRYWQRRKRARAKLRNDWVQIHELTPQSAPISYFNKQADAAKRCVDEMQWNRAIVVKSKNIPLLFKELKSQKKRPQNEKSGNFRDWVQIMSPCRDFRNIVQ